MGTAVANIQKEDAHLVEHVLLDIMCLSAGYFSFSALMAGA